MSLINDMYLNMRATMRFFKFVAVILLYFIKAIFQYFSTTNPELRRHRLTQNGSNTANLIIKAFNIELICKENIPSNECSLLVGNHIGFIDIVCLIALRRAVFITSLEMRNTPVLGQIADLGGCAYVDRKNRMSIQEELKGIVHVLKKGFRVVLYAESVSSNGEQVLPFKKTLMMSAGLAGRPIRPFVFNFIKVNDRPIRYEDRDSVCWYGDQNFFSAIWRSLKLDSLTCEIEFLPLVQSSPEDDRTELAQRVHAMVSSRYKPFYPNMNSGAEVEHAEKVTVY